MKRLFIPILALGLFSCSNTPEPQTESAAAPSVKSIEGFSQALPGVFTGGQPAQSQIQQAKDLGVKTIINLRTPGEPGQAQEAMWVKEAGLQYVSMPIAGKADVNFEKAQALNALLAKSEKPVMLHCGSGNRVGALLALAAVKVDGQSKEQALKVGEDAGLSSLRPHVNALLE